MSTRLGSPAPDFIYISASAPDAPPLSDTTIGCFISLFFWIAACIIRAIWSDAPPAPAATTISTGLVGSQAATAGAAVVTMANGMTAQAAVRDSFMTPPLRGLCDFAGRGASALGEMLEGREHAALLVRHSGELKAHLDAGERAGEREVVEIAEVPDAKYLSCQAPEAGAERHVVGLEDDLAQPVGVVARGHHHRGERARILLGHRAQDLEAPGAHRAARRLRVARVAREYVLQTFLGEHRERFAQAVEQIGRGRVREITGLVVREHLVPVPVGARQLRRNGGLEGLAADAVERQARRQHQSFLRAGDGDVDAPFVVAVIDRGKRGDGVDHVERRVAGGVDRLTNCTYPAGNTRRSLVVHYAHRFDLVLLVFFQFCLDRGRIDAAPPVGGNQIDRDPEPRRHLVPQGGEVPGLEHEHAVAGRKRVDQRRFPRAGPRGRVDHHRLLCLEYRFQAIEDLQAHLAEFRAAMVHGRVVDRAQHPVRDIGGPGDLQEVASAPVAHVQLAGSFRAASLSEKPSRTMILLKPAVSWSHSRHLCSRRNSPWLSPSTSSPTWSAPGASSASAGSRPRSSSTGSAGPRRRCLRSYSTPSS